MDKSKASTAFDVMKQFLIQGATLVGEYEVPALPAINIIPEDTVSFRESFSRKIKNHRKLNVNMYEDDDKIQATYLNPDKYLEHLRYFGSVCGLDLTIAEGMPQAMRIWNHYRNMALAWYWYINGIKVIPSVSLCNTRDFSWCLDGLPMHSTLSVCTNGRVRSKAARLEFCEGFYEMCRRLEPLRVVIVGRVPEELESPVEIINLKSRNQQINERFREKEKQCCGTCLYFNGETGDGVQFCDDKEIDVSESGYCSRYKKK